MMHTGKEQMEAFGRFLDVLDELREKCPCDRLCDKLIFRHPHVFDNVIFSLINAASLYKINQDKAL